MQNTEQDFTKETYCVAWGEHEPSVEIFSCDSYSCLDAMACKGCRSGMSWEDATQSIIDYHLNKIAEWRSKKPEEYFCLPEEG